MGNLIAEAMDKVGREGTITVSDGKTITDELDVVEGMRFDRGFISPYFVTDPKSQKVEFDNALILCVEKKVSTVQSLLPILEAVMKSQRQLLIVAEDVESEALATLVVNKLRLGIKVCAVKAPGFGDRRKANLEDIAISTGGTLVSEDLGVKLEELSLDDLGSAKRVTVTKDDTIILDGGGEKESVTQRCDMLREAMEEASSEYDKEKIHERLAKLTGGVAVIKVGGASEFEVSERKDRFVDALNATRAAVEEGIVPGGGSALLLASRDALEGVKGANFDQNVGIDLVRKALRVPCERIARNAGVEGAVIVEKLLAHTDKANPMGYDAQADEYCDLVKKGIIDPTKVQRTALEQAASVAGLMSTTECLVVDMPKEEMSPEALAAMGQGGGGGMGGMGGGMGGMGGGMGF